ncbi:MAG: 5'-3' exonuclease [Chloroflexi bacterium]|nr:5'-3' exonuclease [Chloroflexota bacterium]
MRGLPARLHRHATGERPVPRGGVIRLRDSYGLVAPGATLLIDGSSLAYRAYHAIPVITAPDGVTETNAVHGFISFLSRLIPDRRPSRLHVALDADWRPAFRVDALPAYKAHRVAAEGDPPDPVEPQIALIIEVLEAYGISTGRSEGYEAEDVIASIAKRSDGPVEVVTGDRDLFALVRHPHVRVLYTLRGVSELAPVDQAWVNAKYGIPGDRYMDYAILRGDPSDGLPGVAGIGEKTASDLLRRYGSLDAILAARDLSPTVRAKLNRGADYLVRARRVVALAEDCPVEGGTGEIPDAPVHAERLRALQDRLGIAGPLDRLRAGVRLASAPS